MSLRLAKIEKFLYEIFKYSKIYLNSRFKSNFSIFFIAILYVILCNLKKIFMLKKRYFAIIFLLFLLHKYINGTQCQLISQHTLANVLKYLNN